MFPTWLQPRLVFFFQAEDGIRDGHVTGVQTCALPIMIRRTLSSGSVRPATRSRPSRARPDWRPRSSAAVRVVTRAKSEEHTSELQSRGHLVCRLLLEKKKISNKYIAKFKALTP